MVTIPAPMQAPERLFKPFTSPDWIYELKFDGYRCLAGMERQTDAPVEHSISTSRIQLLTKAGRDCSHWYPEIIDVLAGLAGGPHVVDGEACVLRADGTSDFNLLQARARKRKPSPGAPVVTFCAFDLLIHNGINVMNKPLMDRKALLKGLLGDLDGQGILLVKDLPADAALFQSMTMPPPEGLGLQIEGVIAKHRDSPYLPGVRSDSWRKIKRPGWNEGRLWTK